MADSALLASANRCDPATLLSLASRVEAGEGADRILDAEIMEALFVREDRHIGERMETGAGWVSVNTPVWADPATGKWIPGELAPAFTGSLDAATSLTPADDPSVAGQTVFWKSGHDGEGPDPSLFKATVLIVSMFTTQRFEGVAETEPRARVAACLRAIAQTVEAQ